MTDLLFDIFRVAHMGAFAAGLGTAAFLEICLAKRLRECIDLESLRLILTGHEIIKLAVIGLWVTGLGLMYFRLVVFDDPFTAKLAAKVLIVSALSVNMILIDRFLIPEIFLYEDQRLSDIHPQTLAQFGAIVGFSGGVWISALLLGGIGFLKTMTIPGLLLFLVPLVIAATVLGCAVAVFSNSHVLQAKGLNEHPAE